MLIKAPPDFVPSILTVSSYMLSELIGKKLLYLIKVIIPDATMRKEIRRRRPIYIKRDNIWFFIKKRI